MDYFRPLAAGRILLLRLDRGDLLLESIARMIEGERIANGVLVPKTAGAVSWEIRPLDGCRSHYKYQPSHLSSQL